MEAAPASASSTSSATAGGSSGSDGRGGGADILNLVGSSSPGGIGMFGQPGSGSELLLGGGGFDGSIGNGYLNEGSGGGSTPGFDLSDFPSLGGAVSSAGSSGGSAGGNNGLAAALRQQQQMMAQQQMMQQGASGNAKSSNLYRLAMSSSGGNGNANFNMATEDFPALPGAPPTSSGGAAGTTLSGGAEGARDASSAASSTASSFVTATPSVSRTSSGAGGVGLYSSDLDGGSNQLDYTGLLGGSGGLGSLGGAPSSSNPGSTSASNQRTASSSSAQTAGGAAASTSGSGGSGSGGGSALSGDFGLLGLLGIIRMSDADRNALALGSDLSSLGLNLNSNDHLYSTFAGPWSKEATTREPHYQLPMCYYMQPPALKTGHLAKFQLETLFYIFYALPKDVLQAYAAQELYSREWRYHADSKLWFKRGGPNDGVASSSGGGVQYIYFDIDSWERRLYSGNMHQNITSGLLSEDDVRVKFPSS